MQIYDKPVRLLFRDMIDDLSIKKGDVIGRDQVYAWFNQKYPLIKPGTIGAHFLKLSTNAPSRIHYSLDQNGNDDLLFQIDSKKFRLYDASSDPDPIYTKSDGGGTPGGTSGDPEEEDGKEFAYEKDLQNFLAKNLSLIEDGLTLYVEEGIKGIEFPVA